MDGVRELEFFIIDDINSNTIQEKLDQYALYYEVHWTMRIDSSKNDVTKIATTLIKWRESCHSMLTFFKKIKRIEMKLDQN